MYFYNSIYQDIHIYFYIYAYMCVCMHIYTLTHIYILIFHLLHLYTSPLSRNLKGTQCLYLGDSTPHNHSHIRIRTDVDGPDRPSLIQVLEMLASQVMVSHVLGARTKCRVVGGRPGRQFCIVHVKSGW